MSTRPGGALRRALVVLGPLVLLGLLAVTAGVGAPAAARPPGRLGIDRRSVCAPAVAGRVSCLAVLDVARAGSVPAAAGTRPVTMTSVDRAATLREVTAVEAQPLTPDDLRAAYALPSSDHGQGQTIAIVDAYDNPKAESDLAVYRKRYLEPPCTTANGCLRKVNQRGAPKVPPSDSGWALEESLDLDMASAVCPRCTILLVEADDPQDTNLAAAVNTAVRLGADVVSNSYGGPEYTGQAKVLQAYNHPGVTITASTGDSGYGVFSPAVASSVVAVGGTTLSSHVDNARGYRERAWRYAGSGCSAYVAKPAWQHDPLCARRSIADVSAVADPDTPVAVYDSFEQDGWVALGGTSVSAPVVAGVYALAGNSAGITAGRYLYAHAAQLHDVSGGSNGTCGNYLCQGRDGYDGPTGLGSPNGLAAF